MEVSPGIKRNAVLVILKSGEQILILKRKKDPHKGYFTPIGGKLDPHENPTACAIRETREETGIELQEISYLGSLIETSPGNYNWNCPVYLAEIPWQPAPPCDEGELHWADLAKLDDFPHPEADKRIYKYLKNGKPFFFNAEYDADMNLLSFREEIEGIELL